MIYEYKCPICGKQFETQRKGRKYCSPECRKIGARRRAISGETRGDKIDSYVKKYCPIDCVYRSCYGITSCDYAVEEKEPRGCDVIGCTKYRRE